MIDLPIVNATCHSSTQTQLRNASFDPLAWPAAAALCPGASLPAP
jgi:hypothetical protein